MKAHDKKRSVIAETAFSMAELLIVVMVVGIMVGIAIGIITNVFAQAQISKDRHNARNVVELANSALAAGAAVPTATATAVIDALQSGVTSQGNFANSIFKINLTDAEEAAAAPFIKTAGGVIAYDPDG